MLFRLIVSIASITLLAGPAIAGNLEPFKTVPVPAQNPQTPEKIELGKKLFFDRRLSGDGTMSCATCHDPEKAFTDGLDISLSYPTTKNWRNSPTLVNVAFQKYLFSDGRALSLEDQALFPMMSAFEMNRNLDFLEEVIRSVPEYVEAFQKVFGGEPTRERIAMAIAAFERTILSVNTPLDRHLKGDKKALSDAAAKGLVLFMGKGKCGDCHYGVNLSDDKFYALNVPENPELQSDPRIAVTRRFVAKVYHYEDYRNLSEDPGRYLITQGQEGLESLQNADAPRDRKNRALHAQRHFSNARRRDRVFRKGGGKGNTVLKPLGLSDREKKKL